MYAGFWKRCAALIIDVLITYMLVFVIMISLGITSPSGVVEDIWKGLLMALSSMLIYLLYWSIFESSPMQATPGKMALGIKVTDINGNRVCFCQSLGRNLGKIVSNLTLNIGYAMAGFTVRKQALHDKMAHCLVIDKNADISNLQPLPKTSGGMVFLAILGTITPYILSIALTALFFVLVFSQSKALNAEYDSTDVNSVNGAFNTLKAEMANSLLSIISMTQSVYAQEHNGVYALSFEELERSVAGFPKQDSIAGSYKLALFPDYITASRVAGGDIPAHTIIRCYAKDLTCIESSDQSFVNNLGWPYAKPDACCL